MPENNDFALEYQSRRANNTETALDRLMASTQAEDPNQPDPALLSSEDKVRQENQATQLSGDGVAGLVLTAQKVDTVATLTPLQEIEKEFEETTFGERLSKNLQQSTAGQIVGGAIDAVNNFLTATDDLASTIANELTPDTPTVFQLFNERGEFDVDLITRSEAERRKLSPLQFPTTEKPDTVTGGAVRGMSQFLAGFIPAFKALKSVKGVGGFTAAFSGGAFADAFAFGPHEERLSDLINNTEALKPLQSDITRFLASDPTDSKALGRVKNAIEGGLLGIATDAMMRGLVKSLNLMRTMKHTPKADLDATDALSDIPVEREVDVEPTVSKTEIESDAKTEAEIKGEAGETKADGEVEVEPPKKTRRVLGGERAFKESSPSEKLAKSLGGGDAVAPAKDPQRILRGTLPDDDRAININLNRINSSDDIKKIINQTAELFTDDIQAARRGKQSFEETAKLADDIGMTPEQLLDRRKGQAFNAEEALAARRMLVSSGETVKRLADNVASGNATDIDKAAFAKAVTVHKAIQQEVSGVTAEAGRALAAFRIASESSAEQLSAIRNIIDRVGNDNIDDIAKAVSTQETTHGVNQVVANAEKSTIKDVFFEVWINGLLSGPTTQSVNLLSNALNTFWGAGERFIAVGVGLGRGEVVAGEAVNMVYGMFKGMQDGFDLAWQSIKTGEPSDPLSKIESQKYRAISSDRLDVTGNAGRAVDFLGEVVRLPGRFLTAGDEFFKATNYRMELHSLAFREARSQGLKGEAAAKKMQEILNDPPEALVEQAKEFGRVQTFTNELGQNGQRLQDLSNSSAVAKVMLPFVRTPINIVKAIGVRSPLAPFANSVREDIFAGGARRDLALARMAAGSSVMGIASMLAAEGHISGGGPGDFKLKRQLMNTGWKPYAVRIGDEWISYGRLDPVGATIGLGADFQEMAGSATDADALDLASSAIMAVAKNMTDKTYIKGVADWLSAWRQSSGTIGKENKPLKRILERTAASAVPNILAQTAKVMDPTMRDTQGVFEKMRARIPGLSKNFPPVLNMWGDPIHLTGGIGPDIMSPLYSSPAIDSPVDEEIVRLQVAINMPRRSIKGVDLTPKEYHEFVRLIAKEVKDGGLTMKARMAKEMKKASYKRASDGPDGEKALRIRKIYSGFRRGGQALFLKNNPEFLARVVAKKQEAADILRGRK